MISQGRKSNNGKKAALWLLIALALCTIGYALAALLDIGDESRAQQAAQAEIRDAAITIPPQVEATPAPAPQWEGWIADYARQPDKKVDFEALRQRNSDIFAWVTIPDTEVDYPIAFVPKDDTYYLEHDIDRQESKYGAIYVEGYNSANLSDPLTIVYGHNMKDGSMFASLHQFENEAFFDEHPVIRIYMADYMLEYEIVAAYEAGDAHILAQYDFLDETVFAEYLDNIYDVRDLSAKFRQYKLSTEDRILALVTCVRGKDDARYFVQGVLKSNGERS